MKGQVYQVPTAGGLETKLEQAPQNAGQIQNWCVDRQTGGWSSRVGYEPYHVGQNTWTPFSTCGPITSIHARQGLAGGARQVILFEESGFLRLLYEANGGMALLTLASDRHVPTPTEAGAWYTDTSYGTIITNGVNRPVIVKPWPLGDTTESTASIRRCIRPLGFDGVPPPVMPRNVKPYPVPPFATPPTASGAGAVTLWCPSDGNAIPAGGRWGLGFANNVGGQDGDKSSIFGYAVSFITDTGSEGPSSALSSVRWALQADAEGMRHAVALDIPTGPTGTVARKLYRTTNYSDDYTAAGDTTLYLIDIIRNNVEDLFFDATLTASLGQPAPDIPTGPLPAPRARFSALFSGCLWLDGGIDDSRTLYYSTAGLIEQFPADQFIELASHGGGITALFAHYTALYVFRENSIDVVQGSYASGFTVSTISHSVTCRAPHSIQTIPGLGVIFLGLDGVYAITGGLTGGAVNDVVNLTTAQDDFIQRITPDCHPRAVSAYSELHREYHLYLPMDGSDRPTEGLVLHVDRLPQIQQASPWTTRLGFPVGAITTLYDGQLVFGHNTGTEDTTPNSQRGLFVISGKRVTGKVADGESLVYGPPPASVYRSAWFSAGDGQVQKQFMYVTLWLMTTGEATVQMRHYKDFSLTPVLERTYKCQPPDAPSLATLDSAILGSATYRTDRLVPLRFSVAHQSAAWFCFEIQTTEDLVLVGWEYEFDSKGTRVIAGVLG